MAENSVGGRHEIGGAIIAHIAPHRASLLSLLVLPFDDFNDSTFADPFSEIIRSTRMHLLDCNSLLAAGRFDGYKCSAHKKGSFNII